MAATDVPPQSRRPAPASVPNTDDASSGDGADALAAPASGVGSETSAATAPPFAKGDVGHQASEVADETTGPDAAPPLPMVPTETVTVTYSFKTYPAGRFTADDCGLGKDDLIAMYRGMLLQRRFEERAAQMYGKQKISGFLHLYIGQEAISTGTAQALNVGHDSVITAYRDHGLGLALGMSAREGMAEMFGKSTGSSHGKGGSMHFFKAERGFYGGHGIVGGHVPVGVGLAFSHKYLGDGGVSVSFLGDGAVGQGAIHEALNLASLYELPAIVVIENNQYAMGTSIARAFGQPEFTRLGVGYDIESWIVDGMDVLTVTKAMQDAVAIARENRPLLIEMRTYRYRGHSMSDPQKYRTKEEMDARKADDPIVRLKAVLIDAGHATVEDLDAIDEAVKAEVTDAAEFAETSPEPTLESAYDDVYSQTDYPFIC